MRINLFSGPGAGKSTLAARLYGDLKIAGFNIELVHEYIKTWAYLGRVPKSFDQCYIFGKQLHAEDRVIQSGVDHIITDSPVMMQIAYCQRYEKHYWPELLGIAQKFEELKPSLNIFLDRKNIPYQENGRYENYDQAVEMDARILRFMDEHLPGYFPVDATKPDEIFALIKGRLDSCQNS